MPSASLRLLVSAVLTPDASSLPRLDGIMVSGSIICTRIGIQITLHMPQPAC
jgi:hypothetical protein